MSANPETTAQLLSELRPFMTDPHATDELRLMALSLAFELGKAEGRREGYEAGVNHMHESAQQIVTRTFEKLRT